MPMSMLYRASWVWRAPLALGDPERASSRSRVRSAVGCTPDTGARSSITTEGDAADAHLGGALLVIGDLGGVGVAGQELAQF